jgi:hypothetical protein
MGRSRLTEEVLLGEPELVLVQSGSTLRTFHTFI